MRTFLFSNSSAKVWHTCKRLFYLTQLYMGHGISTKYVDEDLLFGTIVHDLMPMLWESGGDDEATAAAISAKREELHNILLGDAQWMKLSLEPVRVAKAHEWGRLFEGMMWGLVLFVLPQLRRQYRLIAAEGDSVRWLRQTPNSRMGLIAKPDTIVEGNGIESPPGLGYIEWKTTGDKSSRWFAQWPGNPQSWTGGMTLKAGLGMEIDWFLVVGFYKGVERDGIIHSPFCWGYSNGTDWQVAGTTKKGWARRSTGEYPGGIREWVKVLMAEDVLKDQFLETEPVVIDWDAAEYWLERQNRTLLETVDTFQTCVAAGEPIPDDLFPKELSMCDVGAFGKPCIMRELCRNKTVAEDPIGSGKFKQREPHHPLEKKYWLEDQERES